MYSNETEVLKRNRSTQTKPKYSKKTEVLKQNRSTQTKPKHSNKTEVLKPNRGTQTKPKYSNKNLFQCHYAHKKILHELAWDWTRIFAVTEPWPSFWLTTNSKGRIKTLKSVKSAKPSTSKSSVPAQRSTLTKPWPSDEITISLTTLSFAVRHPRCVLNHITMCSVSGKQSKHSYIWCL